MLLFYCPLDRINPRNIRRIKMLVKIGIAIVASLIGVLMMWKCDSWGPTDFPSKFWGLFILVAGIGAPFGIGAFAG